MCHEQSARHLNQDRQQLGGIHRTFFVIDIRQGFARHVSHDKGSRCRHARSIRTARRYWGGRGSRNYGPRHAVGAVSPHCPPHRCARLDGDGTPKLDVIVFPDLAHTTLRESAVQAVTAMNQPSLQSVSLLQRLLHHLLHNRPAAVTPNVLTLCTTTATAICGLSAGAKPITHASVDWLSAPICAVPVFGLPP